MSWFWYRPRATGAKSVLRSVQCHGNIKAQNFQHSGRTNLPFDLCINSKWGVRKFFLLTRGRKTNALQFELLDLGHACFEGGGGYIYIHAIHGQWNELKHFHTLCSCSIHWRKIARLRISNQTLRQNELKKVLCVQLSLSCFTPNISLNYPGKQNCWNKQRKKW